MIVVSDAVDEPWSMSAPQAALDDEVAAAAEDGTTAREWRELAWDNGDRYVGEWLGGLMDGKGTWFGADGDRYEGEWRNGERHGRGLFAGEDGETYDGQWKNGVEHGHGVYGDPEHGWILAVWGEGEAVQILSRGEAGEAPPSVDDLDSAAAGDGGAAGASATSAVAESAHGAAHVVGLSVGRGVDSGCTKRQTPVNAGATGEPRPTKGAAQRGAETEAAADTPQTVDEVMACLRKELKTRRAMGNAQGFFTFFDA